MRLAIPSVTATWLVLISGATLAAGCGGAAASARDTPSDRAEARVFASEVNLRAPDLPGFKIVAGSGESEAKTGPLPRQIERCDGGPALNDASHGVASSLLQKEKIPVQTVLSAVYAMGDPAVAPHYITAGDSRRGLGCLQREEVGKRAGLGRLARGRAEVVALRPPLGGALVSGVRVWRCLAGSEPCSDSNVRSFTDRLWFAAGPYVVVLVYIAGPRNEAKTGAPVALPVERRLIVLLHRRASAHTP